MEEQTPYYWSDFDTLDLISENVIIVGDDNFIIKAQIRSQGEKKDMIGKYNITNEEAVITDDYKLYFVNKFKYLCLNEDYEIGWIKLDNGKVPQKDQYYVLELVSRDYVGRTIDNHDKYIPGRISIKDMCFYWDNNGKVSKSKVYQGLIFIKLEQKDDEISLIDEKIANVNKIKYFDIDFMTNHGYPTISLIEEEDQIDKKQILGKENIDEKYQVDLRVIGGQIPTIKELHESNNYLMGKETLKLIPSMEINSLSSVYIDEEKEMGLVKLPNFQEPLDKNRSCCLRVCAIF